MIESKGFRLFFRLGIVLLITLPFSFTQSIHSNTESVLKDLANILRDENFLFLVDESVMNEVDFDEVLQDGFSSTKSYSIQTMSSELELDGMPRKFIRGHFMTVIMLFSSDPSDFLEAVNESKLFNPINLILFSVRMELDMDRISRIRSVQRATNLVSIQPKNYKQNRQYVVSTVLHNQYLNYTDTKIENFIGFWGAENLDTKEDLFRRDQNNLRGAHLEMASFCDDFPFFYQPDANLEVADFSDNLCEGCSLDIFKILADKLNFTYGFQMYTPDFGWGSLENGSWVGMLGQLDRYEKEIAINNLLLTEDRYQAFDSSIPYFQEGFAFLVKIPPEIPKWRGLLYPFTTLVWILLICFACAVGIVWSIGLVILPDEQNVSRVFLQVININTDYLLNCYIITIL